MRCPTCNEETFTEKELLEIQIKSDLSMLERDTIAGLYNQNIAGYKEERNRILAKILEWRELCEDRFEAGATKEEWEDLMEKINPVRN